MSQRGLALTTPALSYIGHFLEAKANSWSKEQPEGYISLVVAENRLSFDILRPKLQKILSRPLPAELECYDNFLGTDSLREAIAALLQRTFMAGMQVSAEHIGVSAGCGAIIDNLFFCIAEPGDSVLIPAPYYPAFDNDLRAKCALEPVPVFMPEVGHLSVEALEEALHTAARAGHPASSLLLTNPNNPLGTLYTESELLDTMAWALKRGLHVISDEIYALSVFGEGAKFTSATLLLEKAAERANVSQEAAANLLHVVFGFSKDFCMSGFRVGCVYTRNATLLQAMSNVAYFPAASNLTQHALTALLEDTQFIDAFVAQNCARMGGAYTLLEKALTQAGLKFTRAEGAMFCCVDLSEYLKEPTFDAERELFQALFDKERLLMTPGKDCHFAVPGNFRICWAAVPQEALPAAVERLGNFLKTWNSDQWDC